MFAHATVSQLICIRLLWLWVVVSFQVTIIATPFPAVAWVVSRACVILAGSWSELPAVQLAVSLWLCYTNRLHLNSISQLSEGRGRAARRDFFKKSSGSRVRGLSLATWVYR